MKNVNISNVDIKNVDTCVIGAGPSGLFSVFACGMLGIKCFVFEALSHVGGQCSSLYPEKPIYDVPAIPLVTAEGLIDRLKEQIKPFNASIAFDETVINIEKSYDDLHNCVWRLTGNKGTRINARSIILAIGSGAFSHKKPPIPGILDFENHFDDNGVFYSVKNSCLFKGKRIVIAGGGDAAVDWAIHLSDIAEKIYLVHRRSNFRCSEHSECKIRDSEKIEIVTPYNLHSLVGQDKRLKAVVLKSLNEEEKILKCDVLLPFFGLESNLGTILNAFSSIDLKMQGNSILTDPTSSQTSIDGIFAIGDVALYNNKRKSILSSFSEAAQASYAIQRFLNPNKVFRVKHSSSCGIPKQESN